MLLLVFEVLATLALVFLLAIDLSNTLYRDKGCVRRKGYAPKTLVIVPCKGTDLGLESNLLSVKRQDYGNYDVVAVVDSDGDAALSSIRKVRMPYIVAARRSKSASGKVNAIISALEKFKGYDVYVTADSDIFVKRDWLRRLVGPLGDDRFGISTMFPRFEPVAGFWSKVRLVWGFIGDGLLEREATRFGWGGSLAVRGELVGREGIEFMRNSRYSVSDDICLTKMCKERGLRIAYTKLSRPTVHADDDFPRFLEWSNRQTALTLLGYRSNFGRGVVFYSSEILVFAAGVFLSAFVSPVFLVMFLHALRSEVKTYSRSKSDDPAIALIVLVMPFIYLANLVAARFMKSITWRGSVYRLGNGS